MSPEDPTPTRLCSRTRPSRAAARPGRPSSSPARPGTSAAGSSRTSSPAVTTCAAWCATPARLQGREWADAVEVATGDVLRPETLGPAFDGRRRRLLPRAQHGARRRLPRARRRGGEGLRPRRRRGGRRAHRLPRRAGRPRQRPLAPPAFATGDGGGAARGAACRSPSSGRPSSSARAASRSR